MYERTEMLIGWENVEIIKRSRVAVFGLGGVGSYVCEALARAGVGELTIIDHDTVSESNINRQLYALHSTVGKYKADVAYERLKDINPNIKVDKRIIFYQPETDASGAFAWDFDYVADCIDNITAKVDIAVKCGEKGINIISSMGTGNKLDPTKFVIADVFDTKICPLAKVMRKELRSRGVHALKVLYSTEEPKKTAQRTPASISFVPSAAGLIIAGEIICDLCHIERHSK